MAPFGVLQSLGFVWQKSRGLMVLAYVLGTVCMYFTGYQSLIVSTNPCGVKSTMFALELSEAYRR